MLRNRPALIRVFCDKDTRASHETEGVAIRREGPPSFVLAQPCMTDDPCYLGRHNDVYDAPRAVLSQLSASGAVTELARGRSRSLCCGSGGGYAWMDDEPEKRISHTRFEELRACGAPTAAVSCPFCMQMFEDAAGALDPGRSVRPMDIAELVAEALEE